MQPQLIGEVSKFITIGYQVAPGCWLAKSVKMAQCFYEGNYIDKSKK